MQAAGNRPKARAGLSTRVVEGETVVLDRSGSKVHQLNATASHVWELCNGERTDVQIAEALAKAYDVEPAQALRDVTALLTQFHELGLLAQSLQARSQEARRQ